MAERSTSQARNRAGCNHMHMMGTLGGLTFARVFLQMRHLLPVSNEKAENGQPTIHPGLAFSLSSSILKLMLVKLSMNIRKEVWT